MIRYTGALTPEIDRALCERSLSEDRGLEGKVQQIIADVRTRGDVALFEMAERFDRVQLERLSVPVGAHIDAGVRKALERAAINLRRVSLASLPPAFAMEVEPGVTLTREVEALDRVGVYAPGGTASYPSSVLMGVVTARAAGVREVIVCTPAQPSPEILAAAEIAGASAVFAIGGAGAIAAMAYGTASVPRVDRIVGPGNAWVAEAKRQVAVDVGIDSPAGPSEILVIADESADPFAIARELLAQAEHDPDACVVALCTHGAEAVERALLTLLPQQPREAIITRALASRGAVLSVGSLEEAAAFCDRFAPEHALLATARPIALRHVGTLFTGSGASVAFGDYMTGCNHVLPTAGAARRASALSVLDFVRTVTTQHIDRVGAARMAADTALLARSEGLFAHAAAAAHLEAIAPRRALAALQAYIPTRPPTEVDLSDNTNLFGVPPHALQVLQKAEAVSRYPTPYSDGLRAAVSATFDVPQTHTVTGCGSDDLIDAIIAAFCDPGEVLAYCPPTFGIVPSFATKNGVHAEPFAFERARLVYLCAPNNPTGADLAPGFLNEVLARTRGIVLLDEAYIDYAERAPSFGSERVIVLRTMSKAYGLAGLRIGFAFGDPSLIREVEKTRGPYKVGALAERAAMAALREDGEWVKSCVAETLRVRTGFAETLRQRGYDPLPSRANFVLVPQRHSVARAAAMRERGVSVRAFEALPGIGDALRITIGPQTMMDACLDALEVTR